MTKDNSGLPDCYACGNMSSDNLCKEHDEMLDELMVVNNV